MAGESKQIGPREAAEWLVQHKYRLPAELQPFEREIVTARSQVPAGAAGGANVASAKSRRGKRSTAKGDAQAKIISALTRHHKYQDGSCLNQEPIGVRELSRQADVSESTVSAFFNKQYGKGEGRKKKDGHNRYRNMCRDTKRLIASLKMLNGEYSPSLLYGDNPPGEGSRDDDE